MKLPSATIGFRSPLSQMMTRAERRRVRCRLRTGSRSRKVGRCQRRDVRPPVTRSPCQVAGGNTVSSRYRGEPGDGRSASNASYPVAPSAHQIRRRPPKCAEVGKMLEVGATQPSGCRRKQHCGIIQLRRTCRRTSADAVYCRASGRGRQSCRRSRRADGVEPALTATIGVDPSTRCFTRFVPRSSPVLEPAQHRIGITPTVER